MGPCCCNPEILLCVRREQNSRDAVLFPIIGFKILVIELLNPLFMEGFAKPFYLVILIRRPADQNSIYLWQPFKGDPEPRSLGG